MADRKFQIDEGVIRLLHESIEMAAVGHEQLATLVREMCVAHRIDVASVNDAVETMTKTAAVLRKVRGILIEATDYVPAGVD